ncbi:HAMP domain-containing sensor histidine kinase [Pedobacter sp. JY14-1]|uniref:sensor histidine kinase n=1 Tax=Pedobacter sp. JY14-1 TaxID=3034151 RepID=UPI0023E14B73|nr:HAMP domain-containing sensor histidine kinase [Pedobacter sp. JY14-1]
MKLQFKLALYNTLTKMAVIAILGVLVLVSINRISVNHIRQRLLQKKTRLITNLSGVELENLLTNKTFTDYNLLREEYIVVRELKIDEQPVKRKFSQEQRSIEDNNEAFQILVTSFSYKGKKYRLELGEAMTTVDQLERTISIFTLAVMVAAVILSLMADLAFTRLLLSPFYQIIDRKLNKVNDPVNFNYGLIKTSTTDFKVLDQSISTLMQRITTLFLTEKEFIANISHELLTPISILNTRLENLLNDEQLSTEGENKIFASLKTLARLKGLINSLLLISRVENRQYDKPDVISVRQTVADVHEELEHRLPMMNLHFGTAIHEDHHFQGNRSLFHTLLANLVSNAIKYNKPGGTVSITSHSSSGQYMLIVSDTGMGMDKEAIENAFVRFEKLGSEKEDSHGLGLAIVRSIAAFHGIEINMQSEKGTGTTVTINFKLSTPVPSS